MLQILPKRPHTTVTAMAAIATMATFWRAVSAVAPIPAIGKSPKASTPCEDNGAEALATFAVNATGRAAIHAGSTGTEAHETPPSPRQSQNGGDTATINATGTGPLIRARGRGLIQV